MFFLVIFIASALTLYALDLLERLRDEPGYSKYAVAYVVILIGNLLIWMTR